MKKDMIFGFAMLLIGIALALLDATGIIAHIVLSIAGVLVLAAYTAVTRREWKIPALEILMRVCYGAALITGIVLMKVHDVDALSVIHKAGAFVFVVLFAVLLVMKLRAKKG